MGSAVVNVALALAFRLEVPKSVCGPTGFPEKKMTDPFGMPVPEGPATLASSVTLLPKAAGLGETTKLVAVAYLVGRTTSETTAEVLPVKSVEGLS